MSHDPFEAAEEEEQASEATPAEIAQEHADQLAAVEMATAARRAAQDRYEHAIYRARAAGVSVAQIARAAQTTRPTIYRITDGSPPRRQQWPAILEAAARDIASVTGDHHAAAAVAQTPTVEMKITRVQHMLKHPSLRAGDLSAFQTVDQAADIFGENHRRKTADSRSND